MAENPGNDIPLVSEQALLIDARESVDEALTRAVADSRAWGVQLEDALTRLSAAYERHAAAAEGTGGTLDLVMQRRPALEHSVRIQHREHVDLMADLQEIRKSLAAEIEAGSIDPAIFRWQVAPVQDAIRRHMGRANDLLFQAFNHDDNGGES